MAVQRRRSLLAPLLLLLLAGAAISASAATEGDGAAAPKASPPRPPRPPRSPKPPPRPPREAAQPQPEDNTPPPAEAPPAKRPQQPAPAPTPQPSPPPEPTASPPAEAPLESPPPPPPVVPTTDLKLILEITGGPLTLTPEQQQSVVAVLSTYAAPYSYTFRAQRPAAPGIAPVPNSKTVVPKFLPAPSPPPAEPPAQPQNDGGNGNNNGGGGTDAATEGGNHDKNNGKGGNGNKQQQQAKEDAAAADGGGGNRRRSLRRQLLRFGGVAAGGELQHASRGLLQSACPRDYQFVVAAEPECAAECQKKIAGKTDQFEFHEVFTSATGTELCCNCRIKKGVQQPEGTEAPADTDTTNTTGGGSTIWWPTDVPVTPLNADGVYVFADCAVPLGGVETVKYNMLTVSNDGTLCKALANNGVSCDTTALRFHGTGEVQATAEGSADASGTTSSASSGLSTAAIIGIVVGGCVGLAAVIIAIFVCVSCRRDRAINNAAKQRTMSRRGDSAQEPESKWRQMYSARMQDSMRRTEEATARQQQASIGPSFLEMQDRQFSEQAMSPQRSFSSKKSFGRGTPDATLARESPDHSLMTGSELSSPPPTDIKPSRSRSLKKLFSSSGKS